MGVGQIPRSKIREYALEEGMGQSDAMIFMRVIRALDDAYLIAKAAKARADAPK